MRDPQVIEPGSSGGVLADERLWGGLHVPSGHVVQTVCVAVHEIVCPAPHGKHSWVCRRTPLASSEIRATFHFETSRSSASRVSAIISASIGGRRGSRGSS